MVKKTYFAIIGLFVVGLSGTMAFANLPAHVDLPDQAEREGAYQPHVVKARGLVVTYVPEMTTFGDPAGFETINDSSDGSAKLHIFTSSGSGWGCSGTLIAPNKILTAAHCVANSLGIVDAATGTAFFYNVDNGDGSSQDYAYEIVDFVAHKNYDGRFWKGHDVAVVTLAQNAHDNIPRISLDATNSAVGTIVTLHGFGVGGYGETGNTLPFGTHRIGENKIDAYADELNDYLGYKANRDYKPGAILHSDFDDGTSDHDVFAFIYDGVSDDYSDTGLGQGREAKICSGDSGGSIRNNQNQITGVTSYTLHVSDKNGNSPDYDDTKFNCTFGEASGYMNVSYQTTYDWIISQIGTTDSGGDSFTCDGKRSNHPKC